jgi:hypothetical protein
VQSNDQPSKSGCDEFVIQDAKTEPGATSDGPQVRQPDTDQSVDSSAATVAKEPASMWASFVKRNFAWDTAPITTAAWQKDSTVVDLGRHHHDDCGDIVPAVADTQTYVATSS